MSIASFRSRALVGFLLVSVLGAGCFKGKNESPNTLHIATLAKIKGLDPAMADDLYGGTEVARAYEGLIQYHYLKRPYVLIANLAESMPDLSADKRTYTFHLKKGVLFQDDPCFKESGGKGREMTADDFVYSYKRLADAKTASPGWWIFDEKIVGLNAWRDAVSKGSADYSTPVEGLKAVDRYTLQLKLVKPSAQFLFNLAQQFASVIPHEAVDFYGKEFQNHAVGTGPFRLVEFNGNSKIVWEKNPTFRKELYPSEGETGDKESGLLEDAGKPIPFVDRIVLQVIEEDQPRWLNFLSGKLDAIAIPKDNFDQAIGPDKKLKPELAQKGIQLVTSPDLDITHISFNMTDPLVGKNKLLRQALSLAYDEEGYIKLFYNGRALPAQGPIPPGLAGYDKDYKNPYRQYNVEKAKELLAKAGYPNGEGLPPLELAALTSTTDRQSVEYMQKMFDAVGVKLKVNNYSWPEFQAAIKNKRGQLWAFAWGADYPDAENFLQLFYSKNGSPGPNDANYSNPELDKLYDQALNLSDSPERTAIYKKMAAILVEDCPWIFGAHRISYNLIQPWLKDYKIHDFDLAATKYRRLQK